MNAGAESTDSGESPYVLYVGFSDSLERWYAGTPSIDDVSALIDVLELRTRSQGTLGDALEPAWKELLQACFSTLSCNEILERWKAGCPTMDDVAVLRCHTELRHHDELPDIGPIHDAWTSLLKIIEQRFYYDNDGVPTEEALIHRDPFLTHRMWLPSLPGVMPLNLRPLSPCEVGDFATTIGRWLRGSPSRSDLDAIISRMENCLYEECVDSDSESVRQEWDLILEAIGHAVGDHDGVRSLSLAAWAKVIELAQEKLSPSNAGFAYLRIADLQRSVAPERLPVRFPGNTPDPTPQKRASRKTVSQKMWEIVNANTETLEWSSREWATHLDVSPSAVVEAETWASMKLMKEKLRLERAERHQKKP